MKLPHLEPIKNLDELIALFARPDELAARLREWVELRDQLRALREELAGIEQVEALRAQVDTRLREAEAMHLEAETTLRQARKDAADMRRQTQLECEQTRTELNRERDEVRREHVRLQDLLEETQKRAQAVVVREQAAAELMDRARAESARAQALETDVLARQKRLEDAMR